MVDVMTAERAIDQTDVSDHEYRKDRVTL